MGVLQRFERRLEGLVEGAFAKVFGGVVQPAEVAGALQREAAAHKQVMGQGRILVPNAYVVEIGPTDYERFHEWEAQLGTELAAMVSEHAAEQGWSFVGDVHVAFDRQERLDTGIFHVRSTVTGHDASPQGFRSRPAPSAGPDREAPGGALGFAAPEHSARGKAAPGSASPGEEAPGFGAPAYPVSGGPAAGYGAPPAYPDRPRPAVDPVPEPRSQRRPDAQGGAWPGGPGHETPRLILPRSADGPEPVVRLEREVTVLGRSVECDVRLTDAGVSRRHAELRLRGNRVHLVDLGSTNGTVLNGRRITDAVLCDGDRIELGASVLTFRAGPG